MRVILSVTMHNEVEYGPHVYRQLDNALELECYDAIVVLDDGSTDGTWDVLQQYSRKHNNIHVFRNEKNSILSNGENRWVTVFRHVRKFNPTWINNRAADILYSYQAKKYLRPQLEMLIDYGAVMSSIPIAHLWRSETWYRADRVWGKDIAKQPTRVFFRFNKNYKWLPKHRRAGMHTGFTMPSDLGFPTPYRRPGINMELPRPPWKIVGLHLGHTTHEKKARKFEWSMASAKASQGRTRAMPTPQNMPPVAKWYNYNGYKGFIEWGGMVLKKVEPEWFKDFSGFDPKPEPQSFYETIKKYNKQRAEEYQRLFNQHFGKG